MCFRPFAASGAAWWPPGCWLFQHLPRILAQGLAVLHTSLPTPPLLFPPRKQSVEFPHTDWFRSPKPLGRGATCIFFLNFGFNGVSNHDVLFGFLQV
jgi:hypothetical protein